MHSLPVFPESGNAAQRIGDRKAILYLLQEHRRLRNIGDCASANSLPAALFSARGDSPIRQSGSPDTRIGTNPSSAAFNNTVLSDINWLNWRIVSESGGIARRLRFESMLTSSPRD